MSGEVVHDVAIVGGCGRAGLPLGLALAAAGRRVLLIDIDERARQLVDSGSMPFRERGGQDALDQARSSGTLRTSNVLGDVAEADAVVIAVGTGDDAEANRRAVVALAERIAFELHPDQLVVVRSTVPAGTIAAVEDVLSRLGLGNEVVYCPDRSAEGSGIDEVGTLPQLIGARTPLAQERARRLFAPLGGPPGGVGEPEEVELAKLFANAYRYAHFAISNDLYMVASRCRLDFLRIRSMIVDDYERASMMPSAGFAGGPCLRKDASMVAEDAPDGPSMIAAAVRVNDHLPAHIVDQLAADYKLDRLRVGVLGLAFKGGSDDTRGSLAIELCELLRPRCREVVVSDPYVNPNDGVSTDVLVETCDLVIVGSPHPAYAGLVIGGPVVDPWGLTRREEAL